MRVSIIGAGNVGTAVGILLQRRGHEIVAVASRSENSARRAGGRLKAPWGTDPGQAAAAGDLVLLTTSDTAIGPVAEAVAAAGGFRPGQTVVHMSGSLSADVLEPARRAGARALSVHPLQSCASVERAVHNLPGSVFSIEGDREAFPVGELLVRDLGGEFFYITREVKPLYHAAACVASNYLVTLVDLSRRLVEAAGMPPDLGSYALLPLIKGTLGNLEQLGIPLALTGPIARGDVATVREHLEVMARESPALAPLYAALGYQTVEVARHKGTLGEDRAREFLALLGGVLNRQAWTEGGTARCEC